MDTYHNTRFIPLRCFLVTLNHVFQAVNVAKIDGACFSNHFTFSYSSSVTASSHSVLLPGCTLVW